MSTDSRLYLPSALGSELDKLERLWFSCSIRRPTLIATLVHPATIFGPRRPFIIIFWLMRESQYRVAIFSPLHARFDMPRSSFVDRRLRRNSFPGRRFVSLDDQSCLSICAGVSHLLDEIFGAPKVFQTVKISGCGVQRRIQSRVAEFRCYLQQSSDGFRGGNKVPCEKIAIDPGQNATYCHMLFPESCQSQLWT